MTLRDYLRALRKRIVLILVVAVLCVLASIGLTFATKASYEASAELFVSTGSATDLAQAAQVNTLASQRVQSYTSVVTSPQVLDVVGKQLNLTRQELKSRVSADAPADKVLIDVHATSHSAAQAAAIANAVAAQFKVVIESIDVTTAPPTTVGGTPTKTPAVTLTVTQPADTPTTPVSPRPTLNVGLGLVIGLLLGVVIALLRELLDNTFKTPEDLERHAKVVVLGAVPMDRRTADEPLAIRADPHGLRAESYRQLRQNLQFVDVDNPPKVIAVTSALPGEGKTSTAINLAGSLAEAGQRVCLIEADLRKPTIATVLGLISEVGFTSALIGQAPIEDVIQNAGENFAVLTSGPIPPNPTELLSSEHCRTLVDYVSEYCDVVVIDTAPLLPVADGAAIAALADATLLVVRAAKTTRDQVRRGLQSLANVGVAPVGVVLSRARTRTGGDAAYYYYTYRPTAGTAPRSTAAAEGGPVPFAGGPGGAGGADKGPFAGSSDVPPAHAEAGHAEPGPAEAGLGEAAHVESAHAGPVLTDHGR